MLGRYLFAGWEWDGELGLYYNRARFYDPATGRFVSEDPIRFAAGDVNLYRYASNAPLLFWDPTGQAAIVENAKKVAAVTVRLVNWGVRCVVEVYMEYAVERAVMKQLAWDEPPPPTLVSWETLISCADFAMVTDMLRGFGRVVNQLRRNVGKRGNDVWDAFKFRRKGQNLGNKGGTGSCSIKPNCFTAGHLIVMTEDPAAATARQAADLDRLLLAVGVVGLGIWGHRITSKRRTKRDELAERDALFIEDGLDDEDTDERLETWEPTANRLTLADEETDAMAVALLAPPAMATTATQAVTKPTVPERESLSTNHPARTPKRSPSMFSRLWLIGCLLLAGFIAAPAVQNLVLDAQGPRTWTKPIEEVQPGDWVLAAHEDDPSVVAPRPVRDNYQADLCLHVDKGRCEIRDDGFRCSIPNFLPIPPR